MGLRNWYEANVMPRLITCACSQGQVMKRRAAVVPRAAGDVFELGCGGGINHEFYDPKAITSYAGIDPHEGLLDGARAATVAASGSFDKAALLLFFISGIIYSFFYPLPYSAESVRGVPVAVVDQDNSALSRQLIRYAGAHPGIDVVRVTTRPEDRARRCRARSGRARGSASPRPRCR